MIRVPDHETFARRRGLPALLACLAGVLLISAAAAAYRPSVDYRTADPKADALKAFAHGDSRYLSLGASDSAPLPQVAAPLPNQALDPDRDVRIVPPIADRSLALAQLEYFKSYNSMMAIMVSRGNHGGRFERPRPLSRLMFWVECILLLTPIMSIFYLYYRLGPYRVDGCLWVVSLLGGIRHLSPSSYREEGRWLLRLVWLTMAVTPIWALLMIFGLLSRQGPLR